MIKSKKSKFKVLNSYNGYKDAKEDRFSQHSSECLSFII